jgi:hypothetical protein
MMPNNAPFVAFLVYLGIWSASFGYFLFRMGNVARRHNVRFRVLCGIASNPFFYPHKIKSIISQNPRLKADVDRLYKIMYVQSAVSAILLLIFAYIGAHSSR